MSMLTLSLSRLHALLSYDPETGFFFWKVSRGRLAKAGQRAGSPNADGYINIKIDGRLYRASRLAWAMHYGCWPEKEIDHIDGNRSRDAITNLRQATHAENGRNRRRPAHNTSGATGVHFKKATKRWFAMITVDGELKHLGYFSSKKEAMGARHAAVGVYYGEFGRYD